MTTYKQAGVDIEAGDAASKAAYTAAKNTFASREGMIGAPVTKDGGYAGMLDMGDFYLVQNDDGVGTKVLIANKIEKYDTLGYDLLCMVVDDAVCLGAEVVSITNTLDVARVDAGITEQLMQGLQEACNLQKVVIPGGEIAEVPDLSKGLIWNATAVGIVGKDKVIDGSAIKPGHTILALPAEGFRSNGLTLTRYVLDVAFGPNWPFNKFDDEQTWGEAVLTPSIIYHDAILNIIGRYGQEAKAKVTGISHITGGGLHGNLSRILTGATINWTKDKVPPVMLEVQKLGDVSDEEAFKTWNMGMAMLIVTPEPEKVTELFADQGITAYNVGEVTDGDEIVLNYN
jgi:phosphoribosylformylglycinamidine cyclo-ligase